MQDQNRTSRRKLLGTVLCAAALAMTHWGAAVAQAPYPNKPITFVVPYPAGGANDMMGRLLGQKMGEALGTPVVVDNKPGAAALIGATAVARAPADGYTVLVGGLATHAASPNMLKAEYDPLKDFEPIGMVGTAPIVVIVPPDSPLKSLKDLAEAAKKDPKGVMYGSSGNGSPLHLAGELFTSIAKVEMQHVAYKGGNAHIVDLLGGRIPVIFDTTTNATPLIKSGKVRAIAVGTAKRLPDLPNVPTFAESGYPQFQFATWYALFAPAKTPKDVTAKLTAALVKTLKEPEAAKKLNEVGVTVASGESAELAKFVPIEYERIGKLIKSANIQPD